MENRFPIAGYTRTGSILEVGGDLYRCPDPLFTFVERIDEFNESGTDVTQRLEAWGRVARHLPEDARVDDYLRNLRVVFATSFTMRPFLDSAGDADFMIVPGWCERTTDVEAEESGSTAVFKAGLPEARQTDFNDRFNRFESARDRYAIGAGWHLVLAPEVKVALGVARRMKDAEPDTRREFVTNPHAFFREGLEFAELDDVSGNVDTVLGAVFWDEGYSERVAGIGLWQPKVLPWLRSSGEAWLPGEDLGIRIGDQFVRLEAEELPKIRLSVERAMAAGHPSIERNGTTIPATKDTLEALDSLIGKTKPKTKKKDDGRDGPTYDREDRIVLLVKENFEVVDYERAGRPTRDVSRRLPACVSPDRPLPHQKVAFAWLQEHWSLGSPGALLADDMGLGKTFVALMFLAWVRELMGHGGRMVRKPIVTVAPTALIDNWREEADKHLGADALGAVVEVRGATLKTLRLNAGRELAGGLPVLDVGRLAESDWVLTTYETWRDYQHSFSRVSWAVAVFDEVQKVKNPAAAVTDAAKAVKADFVIALTGTPVENRLADLWCIVDLIQPGRLGPLKVFSNTFEKSSDGVESEQLESLREQLMERPPRIMLRRLKEDHLAGLPKKHEHFPHRLMPAEQAATYADRVGAGRLSGRGRGHMLETLGALRSISLHPGRSGQESDTEFIQLSARLVETFEILDTVEASGEKVLVFLEAREMQGILSEILQRRYTLPGPPLIINGAVSGPKRHQRVREFQSRTGFDVMLISPKAGGVGLTLTAANNVIHLSRWWNPAVEEQCTDRVYRIGQEREVQVYHPIAVHPQFGEASFDLRLDALLRRKRDLSHSVLAPPAATSDDFARLFAESVENTDQSTHADQVDLERIDLMEPEAFERWVLERLREFGFFVQTTPRSGDAGADGIARSPPDSDMPDLLIQCKHTQSERSIGPEAVEEVIRSRDRYDFEGPVLLVVVTNAASYTDSAQQLARTSGAKLIHRGQLTDLRTALGLVEPLRGTRIDD